VVLGLEGLHVVAEFLDDGGDVLEVVLLKSLELLDGGEELLELCDTAAEKVESTEDLGGVEVELLRLGNVLKTLLGEFVLLHVRLMEVQALLEHLNEIIWGVLFVVPQDGVVDGGSLLASSLLGGSELTNWGETLLDAAEVDDVETAVRNHLVGDSNEKTSHALVGVVVASDGVDHLNRVHKCGKSVLDELGGTVVEGLNELLEGLEVLNVVLGLVQSLGNAQLDGSPLGGGEVNLVTGAVGVVAG
jgi:hypothetical protein